MSEADRRPDDGERPVERSVTAELLARYDRPGPRYTSYPTAVEFDESVSEQEYLQRLARADEAADEPLSFYLHLPFCRSRCLYCGCHVLIVRGADVPSGYLDLLRREIDLLAERLPHRRHLSQLHLGGGTPTYHEPKDLERLASHLLSTFPPQPEAEIAIEVDPRVTTDEHIDALAGVGFNRISLGVQDFSKDVQRAVARIQTVKQTGRLIERARAKGFSGINVDLIYGLPNQRAEGFEATLEEVIGFDVDRVAVYSFAYIPWVKEHQKKLDEGTLPDREAKFRLFALAREKLLEAGYEPIGMDHFARPDDELARARREGRLRRNFQGYTVIPASDVIGLGISAIGDVRGAYVQNEKDLARYRELIEGGHLAVVRGIPRTHDDEIRREVIHDLMCNFQVDVKRVERAWDISFAEYFEPDLQDLAAHEQEGLVTIGPDRIRATPTGELFVRNLAMCFDRYWREKHAGKDRPVFSRTV
jgi:oxygen-independent coproporphyrinogen-3 oxidase